MNRREIKMTERKLIDYNSQKYVDFVVYGTFTPPSGPPFIIIRMPKGRVPWSKKIAPAINKLVRQWKNKNEEFYCNIDGEHTRFEDEIRLWDTRTGALRYEWNGQELVNVERDIHAHM
jgi:hypothetical protein